MGRVQERTLLGQLVKLEHGLYFLFYFSIVGCDGPRRKHGGCDGPRRKHLREELPIAQGQGRRPRRATPCPKSGGCAGTGGPIDLLHVQGQEG